MYKIEVVKLPMKEGLNIILGKTHFIKSAEDIPEALAESSTSIKFGFAFNEASGKRLIRHDGNDKDLEELAIEAAKLLSAGHVFVVYIKDAWPINVLNRLKQVSEVVEIVAATANPIEAIIVETSQGRGLLGVVDGFTPVGVEKEEDIKERKEFLRKIGYKR